MLFFKVKMAAVKNTYCGSVCWSHLGPQASCNCVLLSQLALWNASTNYTVYNPCSDLLSSYKTVSVNTFTVKYFFLSEICLIVLVPSELSIKWRVSGRGHWAMRSRKRWPHLTASNSKTLREWYSTRHLRYNIIFLVIISTTFQELLCTVYIQYISMWHKREICCIFLHVNMYN